MQSCGSSGRNELQDCEDVVIGSATREVSGDVAWWVGIGRGQGVARTVAKKYWGRFESGK